MKKALCLAALLLVSTCFAEPAIRSLNVTTKDGSRHFLLVVPSHFNHAGPAPLVLLLHGHSGTAAGAVGERGHSPLADWVAIAERDGVLIAALDGVVGADGKTGWNDCRSVTAGRSNVDDVAFANAVATELIAGLPHEPPATPKADAHRIYVMGMSNGGIVTFRLAEQMQPAPAAIVTVAASMPAFNGSACPLPTRALPVLLIQGTADPVVPYAGGQVGAMRGEVMGAERTAAVFAELAKGKPVKAVPTLPTPLSTVVEPHLAANPTTADLLTYTPPGAAFPVELLRINGGGHIEPSIAYRNPSTLYASLVGKQNTSIEAAEFAWQFLRDKHN